MTKEYSIDWEELERKIINRDPIPIEMALGLFELKQEIEKLKKK